MPVKAFKSINMMSFYFHWGSVLIINEKELKTLKITIIGENMYATLLTSLVITLANGESRLTTFNFKAINFAREIRGRRLHGRVIKEIEVDSESYCRLLCVEESSCLSYNFGPGENKKMFKCQLSDSDRFASFNNFTDDNTFLYRGVKVRNFRYNFSRMQRASIILPIW